MQAVTGVFVSRGQAERAFEKLEMSGLNSDRITLLTPGDQLSDKLKSVPVDAAEQPGIGKAIGAVVGGAAGLSGAFITSLIPGVGAVSALGLLGAAILTAAGTGAGAAAGSSLERSMSEGLPEDEIFVYEDALRKGRTVLIALAENEESAETIQNVLREAGAESVDAAREQWWIGLRNAEAEHYTKSGGDFSNHEKYYRLGFEAALHARTRCMEFDQVSAEMESALRDAEEQNPGLDIAGPFTQGYQRGRDYYQRQCDESQAA